MGKRIQRSQPSRAEGETASTRKKDFQGHCEDSTAIELMWITTVQTVTIAFKDKPTLKHTLQWQKGINSPLINQEILGMWRMLAGEAIDGEGLKRSESLALRLEECKDIALLGELTAGSTKNVGASKAFLESEATLDA
jgi:hypothetical protein